MCLETQVINNFHTHVISINKHGFRYIPKGGGIKCKLVGTIWFLPQYVWLTIHHFRVFGCFFLDQ